MARPTRARRPHVHAEDEDGCLCDITITAADLTGDADLPVAAGGVAASGTDFDDDVDGCDADFTRGKGTTDEDLPEAHGGVA